MKPKGLSYARATTHFGRIINLTDATGILVRWMFWLMIFNFEIFHEASCKHQGAATLSRLSGNVSGGNRLGDDTPDIDFIRTNKEALNSSVIDASNVCYAEINSNFKKGLLMSLEFIGAKWADAYCNQLCQYIGLSDSAFTRTKTV